MATTDYIVERNSCRVCGLKNLAPILSLGELYVSDFVDDSRPGETAKQPLELVLCNVEAGGCGLLQLRHTVSHEAMYRNYWYRSGMNRTMTDELNGIAATVEELMKLKAGDYVIDIGANDGTLLRGYATAGLNKIGYEPARNLEKYNSVGTTKVFNDFFNYAAWKKEFGAKKAKAITAIAMFYDLEDPNTFVGDVAKCLDPEGVFIIQMSYLPLMLSQNAFDNICVKPETILLGDNKPIKEIKPGNLTFGVNGKLVSVKKTMQRAYDGDMVSISPMYLEPISATPNHPILVVQKEQLRFVSGQLRDRNQEYKIDWVPAGKVKRGDWVVMPRLGEVPVGTELDLKEFNVFESRNYRRGLLSLPLNVETAWMLGMYVAEGHVGGRINNPYINFTLHKKEKKIYDRLKKIFASLGYIASFKVYEDRGSMEVRIVCAALARAFTEWVGKGARNKHIPDFMLLAPAEIKSAFLRGLFEGDGYIKNNKVRFHTASKVLALQVQLMVASLGGMLGISYVKPYPRIIRGGEVHSGDSWQLRGSSHELAKIFGYSYEKGKTEPKQVILEKNYILVPVQDVVSEPYKGKVFNVETGDSSYLVSNAVVHNCHEHVEYYSLLSLENLLKRQGLEVFDVETNDVNGGSFRVYMRHTGKGRTIHVPKGVAERVAAMRAEEMNVGLHEKKVHDEFVMRVENIRDQLSKFIKEEKNKGKKVYVYGASTKGNTLLQYFNLDSSLIAAAAERNPDKWGKRTIGTNIPIISEEQARNEKPDYFLVLPWHFIVEFKSRESEFLRQGGKFIVPLPTFKIIGNE